MPSGFLFRRIVNCTVARYWQLWSYQPSLVDPHLPLHLALSTRHLALQASPWLTSVTTASSGSKKARRTTAGRRPRRRSREDLSEDLRDAWERLRETAVAFGEQRIYASHNSIMFSRKSCYFFVRPKRSFLEVCVFLGRALKAPQVRRVDRASKSKVAHIIQISHRDEVEPPITDWLEEAYRLVEVQAAAGRSSRTSKKAVKTKAAKRKVAKKKTARTRTRRRA